MNFPSSSSVISSALKAISFTCIILHRQIHITFFAPSAITAPRAIAVYRVRTSFFGEVVDVIFFVPHILIFDIIVVNHIIPLVSVIIFPIFFSDCGERFGTRIIYRVRVIRVHTTVGVRYKIANQFAMTISRKYCEFVMYPYQVRNEFAFGGVVYQSLRSAINDR